MKYVYFVQFTRQRQQKYPRNAWFYTVFKPLVLAFNSTVYVHTIDIINHEVSLNCAVQDILAEPVQYPGIIMELCQTVER